MCFKKRASTSSASLSNLLDDCNTKYSSLLSTTMSQAFSSEGKIYYPLLVFVRSCITVVKILINIKNQNPVTFPLKRGEKTIMDRDRHNGRNKNFSIV